MFTLLSLPIVQKMIEKKRATVDSVMAVTVLGMLLDLSGLFYLMYIL